jgi:hypothetical protein
MKVRVKSSHKADEVSAVQKRYSRIVGKYVLFQELAVSRLTFGKVNLAGRYAVFRRLTACDHFLHVSRSYP